MADQQCVLVFDGQDDCVNLGKKPEFKIVKNITIEAWIYAAEQKQWAAILSNIFDTGLGESGYGLLLDGSSGIYFGLEPSSQGSENLPYLSSGADSLSLNQWHHVAGTYDGQQMKVYVDGVEKATQAIASDSINYNTENDLLFGMYKDDNEAYAFKGKIAEVRLWDRTRSQDEIKADMNHRLTGNEAGLVGYWPLNECSGNTITDKTSKGNNGAINGATWEQQELPLKPAPTPQTGKIVVSADEWTLSNEAIKVAPDATIFATNIAKWFVGDRTGKFHAYSTNFGLTGSALAEAMQKAGHTWTTGINISWDIATLLTYDGIFVGGDVADNQVLIEYVKAGGNVYIMAGTGWGGAQGEANHWNPFLNAFGFNLLGEYNGLNGNQAINHSHPILAGVKELFQNHGNSIVNLDAASGKNQVVVTHSSGQGLIATFDGMAKKPETSKTGKIVVNADEWTLSNEAIKVAPDATVFATNIAKWFVGDRTGKFHAYSTNFGLTGSALAEAMQKAGHTWTTGINISWDIATLLTYDGIFVGGDVADNQVLIEYVKAGGNVYIMAGTGWGGAQGEANHWNPFLNAFGFNLLGEYNGLNGNQAINHSHPILAGVKELFQNHGNSIVNLDAASGKNQVVVTHSSGQGLIATFEGTPETASKFVKVGPKGGSISEPQPESTVTPKVEITTVFYKGKVKKTQSDEYVEITNQEKTPADVSGWQIASGVGRNKFFTFPAGTKLAPGQSVRVYTNEVHPESGGFSCRSGVSLWKDTGDEAKLLDAKGNLVSGLAYDSKGNFTKTAS